jgi:hypothetical protein
VNETQEGSDVQVARYHAWLAAREKYGLTGEHGTTLITDPTEAKKVGRYRGSRTKIKESRADRSFA